MRGNTTIWVIYREWQFQSNRRLYRKNKWQQGVCKYSYRNCHWMRNRPRWYGTAAMLRFTLYWGKAAAQHLFAIKHHYLVRSVCANLLYHVSSLNNVSACVWHGGGYQLPRMWETTADRDTTGEDWSEKRKSKKLIIYFTDSTPHDDFILLLSFNMIIIVVDTIQLFNYCIILIYNV